jgi:hypothetical protein
MMAGNKPKYKRYIEPQPLYEAAIGRWLWALQDCRRRTFLALEGLQPGVVDRLDPLSGLSIGSLLYHISAVEVGWLYEDILQKAFPPEVDSLFPWPVSSGDGHLTTVLGVPLSKHIRRMDMARSYFLGAFVKMTTAEFRRPVRVRKYDYDLSPEWVIHHLLQHEAEHRGHIQQLRQRAEDEGRQSG